MAENDYRIELGVKLNTDDLKTEISKINDKHKIQLGIDLKVNDIRDRIRQYNTNSNNAKLKLGIKLDTDDLKRQINQLNLNGVRGGVSIPIDAESLETSLNEVATAIKDIKNALGTLDSKSGMKDLLSSVNQIADALGKATDESHTLINSLNALSKKDFSVNFGIKFGGSNSVSNNTAYGNIVKSDIIPELQKQEKAIAIYLAKYYKTNELSAITKLAGNNFGGISGVIGILDKLQQPVKKGDNLNDRMREFQDYFNTIKKAAAIQGVDLSPVLSGFDKQADELIRGAHDIKNGTKEAKDSVTEFEEVLKRAFGGSIDSKQLDSIVKDLKEIKEALVALSSGESLKGLTVSFDELSKTLDKLKDNFILVQKNLNGDLSSTGSGISNVTQDFKEVDIKIESTEDQLRNLRAALDQVGLNNSSINTITKDFEELGVTVKNVTSRLNNDGTVTLIVKGLDQYQDAVTVMKSIDKNGLFVDGSTTISRDFKETEKSFNRLKTLAKEINSLEIKIVGLDADKNANEVAELTTQLNRVQTEYRELYSITSKNLSNSQIDTLNQELDKGLSKAVDKIDLLNAKMADNSAVKNQTQAYKELLSVSKEISNLEINIAKLKEQGGNVNQIAELENQLRTLQATYQQVVTTMETPLTDDQWSSIYTQVAKTQDKIAQLKAEVSDTRAELAKDIKVSLNDGDFNVMSKIDAEVNKLTGNYPRLTEAINEVKIALSDMKKAAGTDNEVADVEKLIAAHERYEHALKNVNNQIKANSQAEKDAATRQKLSDDIILFQNKIDAWMTKNSAASKQFGSAMQDLKTRAQNCDRMTLNHLEAEFKQVDKAAEAAGKKMQSFGDRLKTQFSKYSSYFSIASVFMYAEQGLRDMFEQVKLIDSAMTELKKVTDETDESYNKFLSNAADRAKEIGTTIDGLVSSTADFARLGYGFEDAQGLAEVANIYAVVGDEVEGVQGATESLISTMAAFKDEMNGMSNSDFAMSIIDSFNELGKLIA